MLRQGFSSPLSQVISPCLTPFFPAEFPEQHCELKLPRIECDFRLTVWLNAGEWLHNPNGSNVISTHFRVLRQWLMPWDVALSSSSLRVSSSITSGWILGCPDCILLCCKNFFPPSSILWRQILEATSDFLILAWRKNEDQSRRLARGWSMVWLSSRVTGCHTWGESYEHLLKMLEEAIQGWFEVARKRTSWASTAVRKSLYKVSQSSKSLNLANCWNCWESSHLCQRTVWQFLNSCSWK